MRYTEQINYSWGYHWGIFREIWDIFTLRKWYWLVVGLLVLLCVLPVVANIVGHPAVHYYALTPIPAFDPSIAQDIAYELAWADYYSTIGVVPSTLELVNHYWVTSSGFEPVANVLCLMSMGLLLAAHLRGK